MPHRALLARSAADRYIDAFMNLRGVIALWPLRENGGTRCWSADGKVLATVNGAITPSSMPGSAGDCCFIGSGASGAYLSATSPEANTDAGITACAIVWPATPTTTGGIIGAGAAVNAGFYVRLNAGKLEFLKRATASITVAPSVLVAGRPHFVVGTKAGATTKLYIDGVDVTGTVTNATLATTTAVQIFAGNGPTSENLAGRIAMAGLLNRLMTPQEAAMLSALALGR